MAATVPLKKLPYMREWMTPADPPKEVSKVKKINVAGRYSSVQIK